MAKVEISYLSSSQTHIIDEIVHVTRAEQGLTPRSANTLIKLANKKRVAIARTNRKVVGWLIAEPLAGNCQEIGMAYVVPTLRRQGIIDSLLTVLIDSTVTTLIITYSADIADYLQHDYSFKMGTLMGHIRVSRGSIVLKRLKDIHAVRSVFRHTTKQIPIYLYREPLAGDKPA